MAARAVVGRDEELGSVEAFLAEVERGPAALVLSGEAGVGKTILWETGVEEARKRLGCVLCHRSVAAEASLAFGGLSDLLEPVLEEVAELPPLRRQALEVALLLAGPGDEPPDPRAIGLAFLDVLRLLAERGPVLVALDDVQWLDSSSALVVPLALRRLRDERIGLLATLRRAPETAVPFDLGRSFPEGRLRRLSVGPLSLGALHRLLRERLGLELTRPELARVSEASGGNPLFALELGRELVRTRTRPSGGMALRVPERLHELLGGRLARLPGATNDVLLHAAALARPTVELVAAHGDREQVLLALDVAVREGVVELDDSRLRFAHPLLASICYEQAPLWKRRAVHQGLAAAISELEERARHLALAAEGPDAGVASELDLAAERAAARGAPAAAAELCELAAELTPADPALARQRRLRAANSHRLAGDPERAAAMLERLLAEVPSGVERADALYALALTRTTDAPTMVALCADALGEAAGDNVRSSRILAYRSFARMFEGDVPGALLDARTALERAEQADDPSLLAVAIARIAQAEAYAAEITPGLIERGVEVEEHLGLSLEYYESPRVALARVLMQTGELERARAILEALEARAAARGDEGTRQQVLGRLTQLEWLAGRWQRALGHTAVVYELLEQAQETHLVAHAGRIKGLIEVDLGLVEEARASATAGLAAARAMSDEFFTVTNLGVLGRLELAVGNLQAAGGHLRDLPGRLLSRGLYEPTAPVWADAIETLIALGELAQARAYLEAYELHSERLSSPWAVAAAARCRGLFAAAEGDPAAAFAALDHAVSELAGLPYPLERARTLLCLGVVRRQTQQKKVAREALEQALAIFDELGARLWAEKARAELRRIGGRRPTSAELTETERRVAALAAQGRSNREIAAELFMGVSTVEMHLSRAYRKLGVRRAGLAGRLATRQEEPVTTVDDAAQA
jgi:ATP/maltotriose-dependent transcriptional regulator MalT